MDSQSAGQAIQMLIYLLIPIVIAVFGLIAFLVYLYIKEKAPKDSFLIILNLFSILPVPSSTSNTPIIRHNSLLNFT